MKPVKKIPVDGKLPKETNESMISVNPFLDKKKETILLLQEQLTEQILLWLRKIGSETLLRKLCKW
jgi:hypothetical protein